MQKMITNKPVPQEILERASEFIDENDPILFAIVGDLNLEGKYDTSAFLVTSKKAIAADKNLEGGIVAYDFSDIKKASVKRMYGNALIRI